MEYWGCRPGDQNDHPGGSFVVWAANVCFVNRIRNQISASVDLNMKKWKKMEKSIFISFKL